MLRHVHTSHAIPESDTDCVRAFDSRRFRVTPLHSLAIRELERMDLRDAARLVGRGMCDNPLNVRAFCIQDSQSRARALARFFGPVLVQRARSKPTAFQTVSFQQVGSDGCFEPAEHVGLAGPRVPRMKKLPLAGGAGATFSRARSLPPSGGSFFKGTSGC